MAKGDHLRVDTSYGPFVQHHGIDMGDGTVIHFRKKHVGALPQIARTSIEDFSNGKRIAVIERTQDAVELILHPNLPPDQVIANAESLLMLQETGQLERYNLWKFNCEHLATLCKTGLKSSGQIEDASNMFDMALPVLATLVDFLPFA